MCYIPILYAYSTAIGLFLLENKTISRNSCKNYSLCVNIVLAVESSLEVVIMFYSRVEQEWSVCLHCMWWQKHIVNLSMDS